MYTLTPDDINAIKKSNNLFFQVRDGNSVIRVSKKDKTLEDGGRVSYPEHIMPVESTFEIYKRLISPDAYPGMEYEPKVNSTFDSISLEYGIGKTLAYILKVGDSIRIKWLSEAGYGYTFDLRCNHPDYKDQALYVDSLYLEFIPKGKEYHERMDIFLSKHITPNNSARMIRL